MRVLHTCLIAGALLLLPLGCNSPHAAPAPKYYDGEIQQRLTAVAGPLQLEVWQVLYTGGWSENSRGVTVTMEPNVEINMRLRNAGDSPVILFDPAVLGAEDVPLPKYYLVDSSERRYRVTGVGWTSYEGESEEGAGKVGGGETREFDLVFEGVPAGVTSLVLVMENVATEVEGSFTIRMPVPLPNIPQ